ncbi:MAG: UPF0149 family protein [Thalassotalea sp.]
MPDSEQTLFSTFQAVISANSVIAHAAEIHGTLTGLICCGLAFESNDYVAILNDCYNNGEPLPKEVKEMVKTIYSEIWQAILDDSFGFQLMLPDDDDSIGERSVALSSWVQGFNLGFGLQHKDMPVTSEEVKEVIADFAEIANLSDEVDDEEASEQAYFEIAEYVRISSFLIFSELGEIPVDTNKQETIH